MKASFFTLFVAFLLTPLIVFGQGGPNPPDPPGPGSGGCDCSIECPNSGWVQSSVTIRGTADPDASSTVTVTLIALADGFDCGDSPAPGMVVGTETVSVDEDTCEWEVDFTQGVNAFNPFPCNSSWLDAGSYRVLVSCGESCCFSLYVDCAVGPFSASCCDECWFDNFCSGPCLGIGVFPGGPLCW